MNDEAGENRRLCLEQHLQLAHRLLDQRRPKLLQILEPASPAPWHMDDVEDIEDYVDFEGQADHLQLLQ
jgi:hypothetical protein